MTEEFITKQYFLELHKELLERIRLLEELSTKQAEEIAENHNIADRWSDQAQTTADRASEKAERALNRLSEVEYKAQSAEYKSEDAMRKAESAERAANDAQRSSGRGYY